MVRKRLSERLVRGGIRSLWDNGRLARWEEEGGFPLVFATGKMPVAPVLRAAYKLAEVCAASRRINR